MQLLLDFSCNYYSMRAVGCDHGAVESMDETGKGGLPSTTTSSTPAAHSGPVFSVNIAELPLPKTFAALDRVLSIPLHALADLFDKVFNRNVDSHVSKVQGTRKKKGKKEKVDFSVKSTRLLADWVLRAGEVDPSQAELSAIWEAILDAIMDDEDQGEQLLKTVREARPSDIRFFLRRFAGAKGSSLGEGGEFSRLEALGLVNRIFSLSAVIGTGITAAIILYLIDRFAPLRIIGQPSLGFFGELFRTIADYALPIGVVVVLLMFLAYLMHSTTKLGDELCRRYREYSNPE